MAAMLHAELPYAERSKHLSVRDEISQIHMRATLTAQGLGHDTPVHAATRIACQPDKRASLGRHADGPSVRAPFSEHEALVEPFERLRNAAGQRQGGTFVKICTAAEMRTELSCQLATQMQAPRFRTASRIRSAVRSHNVPETAG